MAVQNLGLAISPLIEGILQDNTEKDYGYFYAMLYFVCLAAIGIVIGVVLYFWDLRTGGILNKVDKAVPLAELITSPTAEERREIAAN
mmetsp:Transcript_18754/g.13582  ORF Transcript_18754/g.13582 Transcript_18754/m.13582 type:complete len:88 (-) Transcript_18754:131-394(-)